MLDGIAVIHSKNIGFSHFVLLSGNTYPMYNISRLLNFFAEKPNINFLKISNNRSINPWMLLSWSFLIFIAKLLSLEESGAAHKRRVEKVPQNSFEQIVPGLKTIYFGMNFVTQNEFILAFFFKNLLFFRNTMDSTFP